jgi:UDP-N-acetylmuramate--alanine ligase
MLPIYPARELPVEGVTSELIGKDITAEWVLVERDSVAEYLKSEQTDVTVSFGAGNIDVVCGEIAKTLAAKITR